MRETGVRPLGQEDPLEKNSGHKRIIVIVSFKSEDVCPNVIPDNSRFLASSFIDMRTPESPHLYLHPSQLHLLQSKILSTLVCYIMSDSCDPVDCSPPGSSVHGDSPGKNTGVGCHALLQGIFLTQGIESASPASPLPCGRYNNSPPERFPDAQTRNL
ncbi:hypothetical protein MG293_000993 [Ovis ammon polii]|uniref:Uncharacterized protein n=1 Tax=Ovis ammon polii TaxID=230172 RepID=A0AAD4ULR5_OVIAM|nr:hypothetical protein MG293_000993 [Ovis ammon polii]